MFALFTSWACPQGCDRAPLSLIGYAPGLRAAVDQGRVMEYPCARTWAHAHQHTGPPFLVQRVSILRVVRTVRYDRDCPLCSQGQYFSGILLFLDLVAEPPG